MVDRYTCRGVFKNTGNYVPRNNSCGCNTNACSEDKDYRKLLKKLQQIDFAMTDVIIYLDAYPCCKEALAYYHKLKAEREGLVTTLQDKYNMPITAYGNVSECNWDWTDAPWPWEFSAN